MLAPTGPVVGCLLALLLTSAAVAEPLFSVSAGGDNGCGHWACGVGLNTCNPFAQGFGRCSNQPVSDQQQCTDAGHATWRYGAFAGRGQLYIETYVGWICCGSSCARNNGGSSFTVDDLVFTGSPGETTVDFSFNLLLTFTAFEGPAGQQTWTIDASAAGTANIGAVSGMTPETNRLFTSSTGTANLNVPTNFYVHLGTRITGTSAEFGGTPQVQANASLTLGSLGGAGFQPASPSLPCEGPVFNLPAGFTVNSPSAAIVNNRFTPPPLQFEAGSLTVSNGTFHARLTGPPFCGNVVVEASADLQAWTPIQTNAFPPLPPFGLDLSVPVGANPYQFFRAHLAP